MGNNIYVLGEERENSARRFLEGLNNGEDLKSTITALENTMGILIGYTNELGIAGNRKNIDAISMIRHLNTTIDALKYIGTHDVFKSEV